MLQLTARRAAVGDEFTPPIVVANADHADLIEAQLKEAGCPPSALILEPCGRNTAPAIALAALAGDPEALLLVMPSDHVIADVEAFHAAIRAATTLVEDGWLATFGISPDFPETGYGYIRSGAELCPGVRRVEQFVEKPSRETAEAYLASGDYFWNGGIFLLKARTYLDALGVHAPAIESAVRAAMGEARREGCRIHPDGKLFERSPSDSIDYAVMEKADRVAVVPVNMGWSDVGSWDALHQLAEKDEAGNACHGEVLTIDSENCLIRSEGPLVAAVGVKDLIVVATGDAVLILPRGSSQDIKRAITELQARRHETLDKPCG
jgi:mannose-1-phosphate guanylyltransferase/mannose-1-phosphate guanylyltransferase/mannose-6-phosphate isomerase